MDAAYTGKQIARQRKALGMTQKELAEKLHVTDKAVSKWERGINFPDLGIIEALALALDTSPVSLLGLENAGQDEIVTTMAEVSGEQLDVARQENIRTGWNCLVAAVMLVFVYDLFSGKDVVSQQRAYQLLHCVIAVLVVYGVYLLVKYDQIRKFNEKDLFIFLIAFLSVLTFLLYQLFYSRNPPGWLFVLLVAGASCNIQWLFIRIMKPKLVKALPMLCALCWCLWLFVRGYQGLELPFVAFCCVGVWIIWQQSEAKKKTTI